MRPALYDRPVRRRTATALAVCALASAGCSREESALPVGCGEGPAAFRSALATAPREVRVEGARLSECLTDGADGAELQNVGLAYVETASTLSDEARRRPDGRAASQLGYLVGAVRRGAAGTPGMHAELVRRVEQEAAGLERSPAFRRGERAGRRSG